MNGFANKIRKDRVDNFFISGDNVINKYVLLVFIDSDMEREGWINFSLVVCWGFCLYV